MTIGAGFVVGVIGFAIAYFTVDIPDPNAYVNSQATIIQYADGSEVGRIGAQNRTIVPLANIPIHLRHAVLAAENKSFYTDRAISPIGILRAIFNNLRGGSLQGGSTITQQYAKTAFLTPDRTIKRKIKEIRCWSDIIEGKRKFILKCRNQKVYWSEEHILKKMSYYFKNNFKINWAINTNFKSIFDKTLFHIANETEVDNFNNTALFYSEKTFKPISQMQPFVIYGQQGANKYLKELGYKTFNILLPFGSQ